MNIGATRIKNKKHLIIILVILNDMVYLFYIIEETHHIYTPYGVVILIDFWGQECHLKPFQITP